MAPAIECLGCGERFETPQADTATPEELLQIINKAVSHIALSAMGAITFKDSHVLMPGRYMAYEPITGSTRYSVGSMGKIKVESPTRTT